MKPYNIRRITPEDDIAVRDLIVKVMTEYRCVGEGYSIEDPEVEQMSAHYSKEGAAFFVIEGEGKLWGCGGYAQLKDSDGLVCELRKMYFYPELRGLGYGQKLLDVCLESAQKDGYSQCYLETVDRMKRAQKLYLKNGFIPQDCHLGNTGHSSCDAYYLKEL